MRARSAAGSASASIIRLMAELGVDEPAVRSSISRLKRRGILDAERVGRGRRLCAVRARPRRSSTKAIGASSSAAGPRPTTAGCSLSSACPRPSASKRHQLALPAGLARIRDGDRRRVDRAGARGSTRPRTCSNRSGLDPIRRSVRGDRTWPFADAHAADVAMVGSGPAAAAVRRLPHPRTARCWPRYRRRAQLRRRSRPSRDYAGALTDWRRLPYSDPGLAPEVLPPGWNGTRAAETFFGLQQRLAGPAHRFVDSVRGGDARLLVR